MHHIQKIIQLFNEKKDIENPLITECKIAISNGGSIHFVDYKEITHCVAMSNYTKLFTQSGKQFILSKTLKFVEASLPSHYFIRVHQSYLLAKNLIICIKQDHLDMSTGISIPISKLKKKEVVERMLQGMIQL